MNNRRLQNCRTLLHLHTSTCTCVALVDRCAAPSLPPSSVSVSGGNDASELIFQRPPCNAGQTSLHLFQYLSWNGELNVTKEVFAETMGELLWGLERMHCRPGMCVAHVPQVRPKDIEELWKDLTMDGFRSHITRPELLSPITFRVLKNLKEVLETPETCLPANIEVMYLGCSSQDAAVLEETRCCFFLFSPHPRCIGGAACALRALCEKSAVFHHRSPRVPGS